MKNKIIYIILIIVILLFIIGYNTNWFGLKKVDSISGLNRAELINKYYEDCDAGLIKTSSYGCLFQADLEQMTTDQIKNLFK